MCGRNRVLRLMRQAGLRAQRGYKSPRTHRSGKVSPAAPNILKRQFKVAKPNQWRVSDITYIDAQEGFLFFVILLLITSVKSREFKLHSVS